MNAYAKAQNFNPLVSWLHRRRYRMLAKTKVAHYRVLDIGCGVGTCFDVLTGIDLYHGVDINSVYINIALVRHRNRRHFIASAIDIEDYSWSWIPDLVICLETLEHLRPNVARQLIANISYYSPAFICSVPNELGPMILIKNLGSALMGYSRHKEYSLLDTLRAAAYRPLPWSGGHKGFDYRTVVRECQRHFKHVEVKSLPFPWLPRWLATNVFITATKEPQ